MRELMLVVATQIIKMAKGLQEVNKQEHPKILN